jgi:hypothetical protein
MEEVARLDDAPLVPGRGFATPPAIDANLRHRIRSLLISRNQRNPPKTPYTSADSNYLPHKPDEDRLKYSPINTETYRFSPTQAIAKLTELKYTDADMGAIRFDGPSSQASGNDSRSYPRRPSQPATQTDRGSTFDGNSSHPRSGLDQRAHGDMLGREASGPVSLGRAKSSASAGSRLPRFHLRTVAPATDVNKIVRPSQQHVPGSYRSEIFPPTEPKGVRDEHAQNTIDHKAIDALHEVLNHNQQISVHPNADSSDTAADAMVVSTTSLKQPYHLLIKPSADHATTAPAAQPVLTSDVAYDHPCKQVSDVPLFVIGDDQDGEVVEVQAAGLTTEHQEREAVPPDGPKISALLAELPPFRESSVDDVSEHHLTAKPSADQERLPSNVYPDSLHGEQCIPLDTEENVDSPLSPLLLNPTSAKIRGSSTQDPKPSSKVSSKLSPISRAMSMLSEFSSRSGIQTPSLRSSGKHKMGNSTNYSNLTARPNHRVVHAARAAEGQRASQISVRKGYKPLDHKHHQEVFEGTESTTGTTVMQQHHKHDESFAKVITDLESLLKEALNIAGNAVSHDEYCRAESSSLSSSSEDVSLISGRDDEEDNHTTLPVHHAAANQKHVAINEPEKGALYQGNFKRARDATPYPAQTRHASTIPNLVDGQPELKTQGTNREFLELPRTSSKTGTLVHKPLYHQPFKATDWAPFKIPRRPSRLYLDTSPPPPPPQVPPTIRAPAKEQRSFHVRERGASDWWVARESIRDYVHANERPPIEPRMSSIRKAEHVPNKKDDLPYLHRSDESDCECVPYIADFTTSGLHYHPVYQEAIASEPSQPPRHGPFGIPPRHDTIASLRASQIEDPEKSRPAGKSANKDYTLEGRHHFSIREPRGFSLSRSHRRLPIARDWSTVRKRYVATVTCITTAFMGLIIGIYAGEVPAIQYTLADQHHFVVLGNVFFFLGLAITTALFYPLPLLHGRKPYTLAALAILLPLQFPQALAINGNRNPYVATYRVGLLLPRMFAGIVMGFANISFITTLMDLFGASLQSGNPHQETVNANDVRRHGGGMGVWLSIWVWSAIGSIGIGFLIGAGIISKLDVSWGYWITITLNAAVLVLNVLTPEVRRSAYRRSMAEVRNGSEVSRRVARGEIKMHLQSTGPIWWWEEVFAGHVLAIRMLKQPGFVILSLYLGWIYGQVVLVIVVSLRTRHFAQCLQRWQLLGALLSKYYRFHPQYVGLAVAIIPLGALLAIPFQKASLFSRSRHHSQRTDSMTFEKRVTWTSHLVRRAIFMISLPFAGLAYTLSSGGYPTNFMVPIIFAGLIGFLSNLAIAECHGIIMETYDTSDLQPGMTGRPRRILPEEIRKKRTNFSCFPRVTAGFAIAQTFAFIIAALVTAWGGVVERHLGAQTATAVMAGVLLILTLLLIAVLWRFKTVQIIPSERFGTNILSGPEDEWKPVIIGNPSGTTRRMSLLELGTLSRWSEIRRRNKLAPDQR